MAAFLSAHAAHPDWRVALAEAGAQLRPQQQRHDASAAGPLTLGFVYFSDRWAAHADALVAELRRQWPGVAWVGSVAVGVCAGSVEYIDEPALALMLAPLPSGRFEVYSGARKLQRIEADTALVHADPATPDLSELVAELADRTASGYLFGGLVSSRGAACQVADGVWRGGLSGVAFTRDVALVSRVTQGCQPVGPVREVTRSERNVVFELDGEPALACLLSDLGVPGLDDPRSALPLLRATLAGLTDAADASLARGGQFGADTRVRHLVGLDPQRGAIAVADVPQRGMRLAFCHRDAPAARRDLVRICSEIRDEVESSAGVPGGGPARMNGAVYVSCTGRGGPHFGAPSAELKTVRQALGDVPLVGFFAAGEIARHHVYGYTGVLTVFTDAS